MHDIFFTAARYILHCCAYSALPHHISKRYPHANVGFIRKRFIRKRFIRKRSPKEIFLWASIVSGLYPHATSNPRSSHPHFTTPLSSSLPLFSTLFSTIPHKEVMWKYKSGVDEKKKTQGMRRDLAHFCGPSPLFSLFFFTTILGGVFSYFWWCAFLGGRKLDEKENREGGDKYH